MTKIQNLEKQLAEEKAKLVYAKFCSPGTFFTESTAKRCKLGNIKMALRLMRGITERYGAKPFGFIFTDGNGKGLGGTNYITGKLIKYSEVEDTKENQIIRSNMLCNDMPIVIENHNSYRFTGEFTKEDCIVDLKGNVIRKGNDTDLMEYRAQFEQERKKEGY